MRRPSESNSPAGQSGCQYPRFLSQPHERFPLDQGTFAGGVGWNRDFVTGSKGMKLCPSKTEPCETNRHNKYRFRLGNYPFLTSCAEIKKAIFTGFPPKQFWAGFLTPPR